VKRATRLLALALAWFVAGTSAAAEPLPADPKQPRFIQDVVAGERHENGEARWDSVVFWQLRGCKAA
jgi:hypothetical protein